MSRWAERFAALSCGVDRSDRCDTSQMGPQYVAICPQCHASVRTSVSCNLVHASAEHGAIVQHDGGVPPAWVEGFARLHPNHPPVDCAVEAVVRFGPCVDDATPSP